MTEFTKEELQIMLLDMQTYIHGRPMLSESPSHKAIREKVEKMIDNYCGHDEGYEQDSMMVDICKKCKEVF